jgi:hypothetical protein
MMIAVGNRAVNGVRERLAKASAADTSRASVASSELPAVGGAILTGHSRPSGSPHPRPSLTIETSGPRLQYEALPGTFGAWREPAI